jgi:hypothetical protein
MIRLTAMKWAEQVTRTEEMQNAYRILVGKSKGNRQVGTSEHRYENIIKMDSGKIVWEDIDYIFLVSVSVP